MLFLFWIKENITYPVRLLEKSVTDYAEKSKGKRDTNELKFQEPDITS